ncbi:hypothetical protein MN116_001167 [Schistosoma mekongi]|uniref:Uncharacterized protein n=1 Tax=Schistosoma mekongi TaxID=38744 RepID=A0AAE1ZKG9_SCHME|nr:hypothetical protein MN116_001167 [Schistosoma mekongi]
MILFKSTGAMTFCDTMEGNVLYGCERVFRKNGAICLFGSSVIIRCVFYLKQNRSPYFKSYQKQIANNWLLTDNISVVNVSELKSQDMSRSFSYSSHNFLPFSERPTDDNHEFTDSATSSVLFNRYSVENSWSNLWRSGLPEQKLTVWLPRRLTDYDDEHSLYKLNEASSKMKLQKHNFSDLNFLKLDSSLTLKTTQKYSPHMNMTSNRYWAGDNNKGNSSTNNPRLSNIIHKFGRLTHFDGSSKLNIIGNPYPINRPPDIKEKTLAQLSLIRKEENCITSIGSGTNAKCFMDPLIGAPAEFLNRINELSKLQAVTKRWERTRCRRRVRKEMVVNK